MLSILIPVYNWDITSLVSNLKKQCDDSGIDYEIIVVDDCSEKSFQTQNQKISFLQNVTYTELSENISRAKIRNLLAEKASFPYLLFIDCDAEIDNTEFINNYLSECQKITIAYGGAKYENVCPNKNMYLRWKYGIKRECQNTDFSSFNFLISKELFNKIKFNEYFSTYGFEDTYFRFTLHKQGIEPKKINNPLIHKGLYDSEEFILRTEECLRALSDLYKMQKFSEEFLEYLKIGKTYNKLNRLHFTNIIAFFHKCTHSFSKWMVKKTSSLFLFDIYKMGFFCQQMHQAK
ncbi:MAG: glycosyltransferase family 2 protein [Bacteroidales bacterium]|nr:glycosyltransferase family 2 protein [Bacteroidales bacterium]